MDNINLWLWLESKNINKKTKFYLYKKFESIKNIYDASREDYENCDIIFMIGKRICKDGICGGNEYALY